MGGAGGDGWMACLRAELSWLNGYGDAFALGIIPHIVSRPGKDVLEGVDALVKEGIADPNHLAVGGYSYGGYVTNWVITQTTRFKAAVTGAGAVEHVANWGNDDTMMDDAYFLGGDRGRRKKTTTQKRRSGKSEKCRHQRSWWPERTIFACMWAKHYLLERALFSRWDSVRLLVFPGEGH